MLTAALIGAGHKAVLTRARQRSRCRAALFSPALGEVLIHALLGERLYWGRSRPGSFPLVSLAALRFRHCVDQPADLALGARAGYL
jgi:hypothetical protein